MSCSWYERRAALLQAAEHEPGWGCVRRVGERHVGRVTMGKACGLPPGFYPLGSAEYARLDHYFGAKQRKATRALPA